LGQFGNPQLLYEIIAEAERLVREAFAQTDGNHSLLTELDRQKKRLQNLEDLYLNGDIDRGRYRNRKVEIDQTIARFEDDLYAASQTLNFKHVIHRITSTLNQLSDATPETKKTLVNSVIERLEIGGGEIVHLMPRPWAKPFF
jgi:hypothetical protein